MYYKRRENNLKFTSEIRWLDNHHFDNRSILNGIIDLWHSDRYMVAIEKLNISPNIDKIMADRGYSRYYELPDRIVFVRDHANDLTDGGLW
jgi:hypothetical protein